MRHTLEALRSMGPCFRWDDADVAYYLSFRMLRAANLTAVTISG